MRTASDIIAEIAYDAAWYNLIDETKEGGCIVMTIYKTRYQARKFATGDEVIVKVDGGYTIMAAADYRIWRNQK